MRCPSCGTENAPDSRFCGGCGARLSASNQRVAPTHKITDDAPFPQRPPGAATPITAPGFGAPRTRPAAQQHTGVATVPAVRPITPPPDIAVAPPLATPPYPAAAAGLATPVPPASRPRATRDDAMRDTPSLSLPIIARRPWGRIALVLAIDVVLAVGGAYLLREGLVGAPASGPSSPSALRPQ